MREIRKERKENKVKVDIVARVVVFDVAFVL